MKRRACQLSLIIAACAAAPSAMAGPEIVKCIDRNGHVTLTDQPCPAGSVTRRVDTAPALSTEPAGTSGTPGETQSGQGQAQPVERHVAPRPMPPQGKWRPPKAGKMPLSRDVATLRQARLQFMSQDAARAQPPRLPRIE